MVVGISSPVTIAEEGDNHVCEISNSVSDSTNNKTEIATESIVECPFEYLNGEILTDHGSDLTDGYIYLTNYRLFISFNQSTTYHYSFINCILGLIEMIELKDNIYLYIQCKNFHSFRLIFFTSEKCLYWLKKFQDILLSINNLQDLFAFKSHLNCSINEQRNYFQEDIFRLKLNQSPWRIIDLNDDYKLSPTYPKQCIIPERISDEEIRNIAKFRSYRRFPTIVWRHENGAVIARSSQPEVGWLCWRSKEDEKMIEEIINACKTSSSNQTRLLIVDARSYTAALANRAKGGGFEHPSYYNNCDVQFMNLPNIHAIRKSAQTLRLAITNVAQGETWLSQLESSRWLHNLSALINAAIFVVVNVDKNARPVLIHCSDGWDRTPQLTTLAKIMLDSYYRTIEGFQVLIQREWIAFGHKFADRCGHGNGATDPSERSPVFLQWIDCVYQLFSQNPTAFEFNEMFLLKLANHTYSCLFGTFLCNTDFERTGANLETNTSSIWSLLNTNSKQFVNHVFDQTKTEILYPSSSVRDLIIWSNLYLRDIRYTSASSLDQSSTAIPTRIRSYEDLPTSVTNTLHRSTSDSTLNRLLNNESSSSNNSIRVNPNISSINPQQVQVNHLQSSPSANSLFGSPQQHGLVNENLLLNQNFLSMPTNPDNHTKQPNFPIDDSSSDIVQLASSIQRFSINIHSADSILRLQSQPRKHTNSTSSTTSSLSEAWSLPRINSYEQTSPTQRLIQHIRSNKIVKLIRKRIDIDGLTKIPDHVTSRMLQKERKYQSQIQNLHENIRRMQRLVYTLIQFNNNQNMSPHTDTISHNSMSSIGTSSCASWQKIDDADAHVTRWIPDFSAQSCYSCHAKFQQWPISRKHHCRKCGNIFCYNCTNNFIPIPQLNLTTPVRVCRDCLPTIDDNNNNTTSIAIPNGTCRQSNGTFPSPGGQKVKG